MKRLFFNFTVILLVGLFVQSCTSTQATYEKITPKKATNKTKNGLILIEKPNIETKRNYLYHTFGLLGGVAGVYGGGRVMPSQPETGYTIGGLSGLLLFYYLTDKLTPDAKIEYLTISNQINWQNDYPQYFNENYISIEEINDSTDFVDYYILVPRTSKDTFLIENAFDSFVCSEAFPEEIYNAINRNIKNITRNKIRFIVDNLSDEKTIEYLKAQHLFKGSGISDYLESYELFPSLSSKVEELLSMAVNTEDECLLYKKTFPGGKNIQIVKDKLTDIYAKQFEEKLKAEEEARLYKIALEKRRASLTSAEREKLIIELNELNTMIITAQAEERRFNSEADRYLEISKKRKIFNFHTRMKYEKKAEDSRWQATQRKMGIIFAKNKKEKIYELLPELRKD
jgi:hypothetical protein